MRRVFPLAVLTACSAGPAIPIEWETDAFRTPATDMSGPATRDAETPASDGAQGDPMDSHVTPDAGVTPDAHLAPDAALPDSGARRHVLDLSDHSNAGPPPPPTPWILHRTGGELRFTRFGPEGPTTAVMPLDLRHDAGAEHAVETRSRSQRAPSAPWTFRPTPPTTGFELSITEGHLAWALEFEGVVEVGLADATSAAEPHISRVDIPWPAGGPAPLLSISEDGSTGLVSAGCAVWRVDVDSPVAESVVEPPAEGPGDCLAGRPYWVDGDHAVLGWRRPSDGGGGETHLSVVDVRGGSIGLDAAPLLGPPPPPEPDMHLCLRRLAPGHLLVYYGAFGCDPAEPRSQALWQVATGELVALPLAEGRPYLGRTATHLVFRDLDAELLVAYAPDGTGGAEIPLVDTQGFNLSIDPVRDRVLAVANVEPRAGRIVGIDLSTGTIESVSAVFGDFVYNTRPCPDGTCLVVDGDRPFRVDLPGGPDTPLVPIGTDDQDFLSIGVVGSPAYLLMTDDTASTVAYPVTGGPAHSLEVLSPILTMAGALTVNLAPEYGLVGAAPGGGTVEYAPLQAMRIGGLRCESGATTWLYETEEPRSFDRAYGVAFADGRRSRAIGSTSAALIGVRGPWAYFHRSAESGLEIWDLTDAPRRLDTLRSPTPARGFLLDDPAGAFLVTTRGALYGLPIDPATGPAGRHAAQLSADHLVGPTAWDAATHRLYALGEDGVVRRAPIDFDGSTGWVAATEPLTAGRISITDAGRVLLFTPAFASPDRDVLGYDVAGEGPGAHWVVGSSLVAWRDAGAAARRLFGVGPDGEWMVVRVTGEDAAAPQPLVDPTLARVQRYLALDRTTGVALLVVEPPGGASALATISVGDAGSLRIIAPIDGEAGEPATLDVNGGVATYVAFGPEGLDLVRQRLSGGLADVIRLPGLRAEAVEFFATPSLADDAWLPLRTGNKGLLVPLDFASPRAAWHIAPLDETFRIEGVRL